MPLTHDIGVRIPYPLRNEQRKLLVFFVCIKSVLGVWCSVRNSGSVVNSGGAVEKLGTPEKRWGYAYSFANLKKKNLTSDIPLSIALNCFILALKLSAKAFVERLLK